MSFSIENNLQFRDNFFLPQILLLLLFYQLQCTVLRWGLSENWLPKTLKSIQLHANITELCPAMVAGCYSNLGSQYRPQKQFFMHTYIYPLLEKHNNI